MYPLLFSGALIALGAATHLAFFRHGEHHMYPAQYLMTLLSVLATGTFLSYHFGSHASLLQSFAGIASLLSVYILGICLSLAVYRLFLHPLRKFPGRFWHRLGDFAFTFGLDGTNAHEVITALHREYGPVVRVGPNKLSIAHPDAPEAIYGANSECIKADFYDLSLPMVSLLTMRSRPDHARQRRIWSPAFSDKAVRGYEQRIHQYQEQLIEQLSAYGGQTVDFSRWTSLYAWDVMGDMAFSKSFGMLQTSDEHWAVKVQKSSLAPIGWRLPSWFFRLVSAIPGALNDFWRALAFSRAQLEERMKIKPEIPDVMSSLLKRVEGRTPSEAEMHVLHGDAENIMLAGSESTSTVLAYIFHCLVTNPSHIALLRKEIASLPESDDGNPPSNQALQYLPHLNAVINETLRLFPAVPAWMPRVVPVGGLRINESIFVPAGTNVFTPQWTLSRDADMYERPDEWIPERWTTRPEMVKDHRAFWPFSLGHYNCIGRPLAYMNLRTTMARLLLTFDVALPEDGTPHVVGKHVDAFGLMPPKFNMVFKKL